jgi:GrpB-like predicted nucleotidyltransferase (UPF0157 family)
MSVFLIQDVNNAEFSQTRDELIQLLQSLLPNAKILEIGSSAVAGCIGKGDLDILVKVHSSEFNEARSVLDQTFNRNPEQLSNDCYQGYTVESAFDVAIQLTVANGPYDDFETFVSLLRDSQELLKSYNALKLSWNGKSMDDYRAAKGAFIEQALSKHKSK